MRESICPVCKKIFIPAPYHIYVKNEVTYCGWNCYNKVENAKRDKGGAKPREVVMKDERGNVVRHFENAREAADKTGFAVSGIRDACREKRPYMKYLWEYL